MPQCVKAGKRNELKYTPRLGLSEGGEDPSYSVSSPSYIYPSTSDPDNVIYVGQSGGYSPPPADMTAEFAYAQRIDPTV